MCPLIEACSDAAGKVRPWTCGDDVSGMTHPWLSHLVLAIRIETVGRDELGTSSRNKTEFIVFVFEMPCFM